MRYVADKDVSPIVNMSIGKSIVMSEYGVQNKIIFSPVEFQRRIKEIILLFFFFL